MPKPVFNIVSKNMKKEHVADEVGPTPMQKHGCNKGKEGSCGDLSTEKCCLNTDWNRGKICYERLTLLGIEGELKKKNNPTGSNNQVVDIRNGS
jgi:hypothetical protein